MAGNGKEPSFFLYQIRAILVQQLRHRQLALYIPLGIQCKHTFPDRHFIPQQSHQTVRPVLLLHLGFREIGGN